MSRHHRAVGSADSCRTRGSSPCDAGRARGFSLGVSERSPSGAARERKSSSSSTEWRLFEAAPSAFCQSATMLTKVDGNMPRRPGSPST